MFPKTYMLKFYNNNWKNIHAYALVLDFVNDLF